MFCDVTKIDAVSMQLYKKKIIENLEIQVLITVVDLQVNVTVYSLYEVSVF